MTNRCLARSYDHEALGMLMAVCNDAAPRKIARLAPHDQLRPEISEFRQTWHFKGLENRAENGILATANISNDSRL